MKTQKLVIGLTGGIGCGKSLVSHYFAEYNVPIIDADIIAHELTKPDMQAYASISHRFGSKIINNDQTLNRNLLRTLVFANKVERIWLEQLLHPLIKDEMQKLIDRSTKPYCIVVIPLLFETKMEASVTRILVVDTPTNLQIARIMTRDHSSQEQVKTILANQVSREYRLQHANDIIVNDGSLENVKKQVAKLHEFYLELTRT